MPRVSLIRPAPSESPRCGSKQGYEVVAVRYKQLTLFYALGCLLYQGRHPLFLLWSATLGSGSTLLCICAFRVANCSCRPACSIITPQITLSDVEGLAHGNRPLPYAILSHGYTRERTPDPYAEKESFHTSFFYLQPIREEVQPTGLLLVISTKQRPETLKKK